MTDEPEFIVVPPSPEVNQEELKRALAESESKIEEENKIQEALNAKIVEDHLNAVKTEQEQADNELLAANQADHDERLQAAKAFNWDAWEEETGLTRPEEVR